MASAQEPQRVSAAEFIRGFASWRLQAARKPVVVTHHGRDAHVLISLDDYRRLDGGGCGQDQVQASLPSVFEATRDGVIIVDRALRIATLNPAASDMIECAAADVSGKPLADTIPGLRGSVLLSHIHRMIDYRERFSGEVPGLLRPRHWTRVDLVPLPVGGAIMLRDISSVMEGMASNDIHRALAVAVEAQGSVGRACISVREAVEDANDALTAMVGVDAAAIRRVRFSALLAVAYRQGFAEALEEVFRSGEPARIASVLVTREGAAIPVMLSIAERRSAYASDGAVIVLTRA